jgi:hypothetical protein
LLLKVALWVLAKITQPMEVSMPEVRARGLVLLASGIKREVNPRGKEGTFLNGSQQP